MTSKVRVLLPPPTISMTYHRYLALLVPRDRRVRRINQATRWAAALTIINTLLSPTVSPIKGGNVRHAQIDHRCFGCVYAWGMRDGRLRKSRTIARKFACLGWPWARSR